MAARGKRKAEAAPVDDERSLEQTAAFFGITIPTMKRWIASGCPVVEKGSNGQAYKISLRAVAAWRHEIAEADETAAAERAEADTQLRLELLGPDVLPDDDARHLSPAQREAFTRSELNRIKLARERGDLVLAVDVRLEMAQAFAAVRDRLRLLPDELATRLDLDEATTTVVLERIDEVLNDLADTIAELEPARGGDALDSAA